MKRGTRVGQAYVAVSADGSGINEEIVNSVDEAGPGVRDAGDRHGEEYGDHFSEGFFSRMRAKFSRKIADRLDPDMEHAGNQAGDTFGGAMLKRLEQKLVGADALVAKLTAELEKDNGKNKTRWRALASDLRKAQAEANRLEGSLRAVAKAEGVFVPSLSGNGRGGVKKGLLSLDERLLGTNFRNNFLNVIPKIMGGVVRIFDLAGSAVKGFANNMAQAEEGASVFAKIAAGFGGGGAEAGSLFSKIAASGPGAVLAITAVAASASILVSVLSAALAVVVSLAATITSGLVGALLVGGAAFGAVTAAVGLTVLAFTSLSNAQKKTLASTFRPLKAEAKGLGQVVLHDLIPSFSTWSKNLQQALANAKPLADVMGGALGRAGSILSRSLGGPGIRQFLDSLTKNLPAITQNLSRALGSFLNGVGSLFAAIMPDVREFSAWLAKIAGDFARWAMSAQGQNAISNFVDRALTSLRSLSSFIGAVGGLLSKLLFSTEAQGAGNSIFDDMTRGIQRFTAYLTPQRLQSWFNQGISLAKALGDAIRTVGIVLSALNDAGVLQGLASTVRLVGLAADAFRSLPGPIRESLKPFRAIQAVATLMGATVVGVIAVIVDRFSMLLAWAGKVVTALSKIPGVGKLFKGVAGQINDAATKVKGLSERLNKLPGKILMTIDADTSPAATALNRLVSQVRSLHINIPVTASTNATIGEAAALSSGSSPKPPPAVSGNAPALISTGTPLLKGGGGSKGPKKYKNPYVAWANSLIKDGPSVSAQIKNAILSLNKQVANGIRSASSASSAADVQSAFDGLLSSLQTGGEEMVNTARSALNSAAESLASATSKAAAKRALKQVKNAQRDLQAALNNQKRINAAAKIISAQKVVNLANVNALVAGLKVTNATLADYAEARSRVAKMLDDANQKLTEAVALRDDYKRQVADSIKSFGSLLTAQAQTIDGVEQALTSGDITSNLQDRLNKIKKFQDDLRLLLAQGLSDAAYKQIVDAGVEQGTQFADALLAGGTGAIQQTNSLVDQINNIADGLGSETSSRLYQAGVDAAQGLVDGLTSLSAQLDSAAYALGTSIANAVKKALGIKSPSRVLMGLMDYVGDGAAIGLDNQHVKVGSAAARLASKIAVSPTGGYSSSPVSGPVSGNGDQRPIELTVVTPTQDPKAVAYEAVNELVGRL